MTMMMILTMKQTNYSLLNIVIVIVIIFEIE